jgi:predicted DNA-binding transcriptional regulator AlpA
MESIQDPLFVRMEASLAEMFLTPADMAEILKVSEKSLPRLIKQRRIPAPRKVATRGPVWFRHVVKDWILNGCPELAQDKKEVENVG